MKIVDMLAVLNMQSALKRTPSGRPLTEQGIAVVEATLADEKNYESDALKCLGCGIILSSLLAPMGCPNCGVKDLEFDINKVEISKGE